MKVSAVVVTYNRRELLEKTLAGLESQERPLDHIVVIDNASTDDTPDYLAAREFTVPHTVKRLSSNTGGAGGFSAGIEVAYGLGFDAFWVMDDDSVVRPGALAPLLRDLEDAQERLGFLPSFAASLVVYHADGHICEMNVPETTWDWTRPLALGATYPLVKSASFVSCLVTREGVHAVGLPSANFFIWYDDAEYTQRLAKYRPGIFVADSVVDHLIPQNRGVNWGDVDEKNFWKFEHGARNQIAAAVEFRSPTLAASLLENMLKQWRGSAVPMKLRLKLLRSAARGLTFKVEKKPARTVE